MLLNATFPGENVHSFPDRQLLVKSKRSAWHGLGPVISSQPFLGYSAGKTDIASQLHGAVASKNERKPAF